VRGAAVGLPASGRKLKGALRTLAAKPLQGVNYNYHYYGSTSNGSGGSSGSGGGSSSGGNSSSTMYSEGNSVSAGARGGSNHNSRIGGGNGGSHGVRRPRERSLSSQASPVLLPVHLPPLLTPPPPSSAQPSSDTLSAPTATPLLPKPPPDTIGATAAVPAAPGVTPPPVAAVGSDSLEEDTCGHHGTAEVPPKQEQGEGGDVPVGRSGAKTTAATANPMAESPAAAAAAATKSATPNAATSTTAATSSHGNAEAVDDDDDALVWEAYEAAVAIRIVWRKHLGHVRHNYVNPVLQTRYCRKHVVPVLAYDNNALFISLARLCLSLPHCSPYISPTQDGPAAIDDEAAIVALLDELGYPILYATPQPPQPQPPTPSTSSESSTNNATQEGTASPPSTRPRLTSQAALSEGTATAMEGFRQQWAAHLDVSRQEVSAALALHAGAPPAAALVCHEYAASEK